MLPTLHLQRVKILQMRGTLSLLFTRILIHLMGPVFFEFIQRKKDEGFGEGNFTALFKSLEADQLRRGALVTEEAAQ